VSGFKIAEAFVEFNTRGFGALKSSLGEIKKDALGLSGDFGKLTNLMGPLGTAIGALALPVSFGAALKFAVGEFAAAEQAAMRLNSVLEATGHQAGYLFADINRIAGEIQGISRIGDDDTKAAAARLATFESIAGGVFERTLRDAAKLAVFLETDMTSATIQLGHALESPAEGLRKLARAGIVFTKEQESQIKVLAEAGRIAEAQAMILDTLEGKLGDIDSKDMSTLSGGFAALKNEIGDAGEAIGGTAAELLRLHDILKLLAAEANNFSVTWNFLSGGQAKSELAAHKAQIENTIRLIKQATEAADRGDVKTARQLSIQAAASADKERLDPGKFIRHWTAEAKAREAEAARAQLELDSRIAQQRRHNMTEGLDLSGRVDFAGRDNLPDDATVTANAAAARKRAEGLRTAAETYRDTMRALTIDLVGGLTSLDEFNRGAAIATSKLPEVIAKKKEAAEAEREYAEVLGKTASATAAAMQAALGMGVGASMIDAAKGPDREAAPTAIETRLSQRGQFFGAADFARHVQTSLNQRDEKLVGKADEQIAELKKINQDGIKLKDAPVARVARGHG